MDSSASEVNELESVVSASATTSSVGVNLSTLTLQRSTTIPETPDNYSTSSYLEMTPVPQNIPYYQLRQALPSEQYRAPFLQGHNCDVLYSRIDQYKEFTNMVNMAVIPKESARPVLRNLPMVSVESLNNAYNSLSIPMTFIEGRYAEDDEPKSKLGMVFEPIWLNSEQ